MPDSTTINYLDLFTNSNSPLEVVPFKHYITPEDTSRFGSYLIKTDVKKLLKDGNRKSPETGSNYLETVAINHGNRRNVLMGLSGLAGAAGIVPVYLSNRAYSNRHSSTDTK